jgi:hypothetical protein
VNVKVDWDEKVRAYHHSSEYKHDPQMTLAVRLQDVQRRKKRRMRAYCVVDSHEYETIAVTKKRGGVLEFKEGVRMLVELQEGEELDQVKTKKPILTMQEKGT